MFVRVSKLRLVLAALLTLSIGTAARASSISSGDAAALAWHSPTSALETSSAFGPTDNGLSLTAISDAQVALNVVADVELTSTQPQMSLVLSESAQSAALAKTTPAAPMFLTAAAIPLNLSDVPEPTTFGLFLLGLAGLFVARRIARKA